jgi:GNAT superfamily N-acetyltransferase
MSSVPGYRISMDPDQLQLEVIHGFLTTCYWSPGIPLETVAKAIRHSVCVGAYAESGEQVGFARLVTDHATFAYLGDVFVLEPHRGKGLSLAMVGTLLDLPDTQAVRRVLLVTRDAHGVYEKLGFERITDPAPFMHIQRKDMYRKT